MLNYIVDDAGRSFQSIARDYHPNLAAEVTNASPLFLELLEQVRTTGVPVHFSKLELKAGDRSLGSGPAVMYRNDNPAKPGETKGK